jgi:glycerophosphoryl diester phosphodiesterase
MINLSIQKFSLAICFLVCSISDLQGQTPGAAKNLPMISAHRGASAIAPENSLLAFSRAIELGADFIEIDVRTTADGVQVIMHDGSLKRTTGLDAKVENTTLATIKELSVRDRFGKVYEDQKVPTLEEVCVLVRNENKKRIQPVKLYVDCKAIDPGEVIQELNQYSLLDSAVFYGDLKTLSEIKKFYEKARLMPAYPCKEKAESMILKIGPFAVDISFNKLDEATVLYCHSKGIKVFSDLLGEDDTGFAYKKAVQLGVDLIQTDDVSGVLQVYNELK